MGRFVEIHPRKDDIVRSVTVKTAKITHKKPVFKIAPVLSNDGF